MINRLSCAKAGPELLVGHNEATRALDVWDAQRQIGLTRS
jgi:hypothetical protein